MCHSGAPMLHSVDAPIVILKEASCNVVLVLHAWSVGGRLVETEQNFFKVCTTKLFLLYLTKMTTPSFFSSPSNRKFYITFVNVIIV